VSVFESQKFEQTLSLDVYLYIRHAALKEGNAALLALLDRYPRAEQEIAEAEEEEDRSPYRSAFPIADLKLAKLLYQGGCKVPTRLSWYRGSSSLLIEKKTTKPFPC
jgi:hypothetical protein